MLPPSPNTSLLLQVEHISADKASDLRYDPGARDVGYGWLRIARSESFPDRVLLVSTSAPLSVSFPHDSADIDQMRASLSAGIYACRNPHVANGELL